MRNPKGMRGILGMAAMMAALGDANFNAGLETQNLSRRWNKAKTMRSTAILTPRQLKSRAKEKRAKLARKLNYNS